jgi:hypothetical protein
MTKVQNFSENLEKNLARLGHEVAKHAELPESRNLSEREVMKESLRSLVQPEESPVGDSKNLASSVPTPAPVSVPSEDFLPNYLSGDKNESIKKSVEYLLQIATNDDVSKAVREARKYPPFVEDAFHDALIDKFLPEMKKRGIIK